MYPKYAYKPQSNLIMTDFEAQMRIIMYYMVLPCAVAIAIGYFLDWQEKRSAKKNKPKNTFKKD